MSTKKNQNNTPELSASQSLHNEKEKQTTGGCDEKNLGDGVENCFQVDKSTSPPNDSDLEEGSDSEEMCLENGVFVGEELFIEMVDAAINAWFEKHNDNIMDLIVENHTLQPRKKKSRK